MENYNKIRRFAKFAGCDFDINGETVVLLGNVSLHGEHFNWLPERLSVKGCFDIWWTSITKLPKKLMVGGDLNIRGKDITTLPDDLIVGGYLNLRGTGITSFPDDLTVGGYLYIRGTGITDTSKVNSRGINFIEWHNGRYIKSDGIFSEVVSRKGNVRRIKKIGSDKIAYLVTDGHGRWAHGETLEEAKRDLIYKISNADKSKYENYTLDTKVTFEEGIEMYRVITGACFFGVKDFVENKLKTLKGEYKVSERISITKGEYGNKKLCEYFKG